MQKFKKILKALLICLAAVFTLALLHDILILCAFKDENFEKRGTDIAEIADIFPAKKAIFPNGITDFSYAHQKHGWHSSIFWKCRANKNSFEKFVKGQALTKVQNPPIYDCLIESELGAKISSPCEVYESGDTHFTYIYDASGQLFGIYTSH
ncbi:MAG: hypothetical protein IKS15_01960 [Opitutales bacterium]|nr:hypothetical protein [Opitutales bacterium]